MPVPSKMADLFTIAASNSPSGSDLIGNSLDDYLRAGFAILRSTNALASASIAAASTTDLSTADGESVQITGSATIGSLGTAVPGLIRECRFAASCVLTNSSAIVLPGATNITTNAGDVITFRSLGSGNWVFVSGTNGGFLPLTGGTLTGPLVGTAIVLSSSIGATGLTVASGANQGTQIVWNSITGGGGRTEYVNNYGAGSGGHYWYSRSNTAGAATVNASLDVSGNYAVTGGITAGGNIAALSSFSSTTANVVLAPGSAGGVILRPNGAGSTTNQMSLDTGGNVSIAGNATLGGSVSCNTSFISTSANWVAAPSPTGAFIFRPNGIGSTTNQTTMSTDGIWHGVDFQATSDRRLKTSVKRLSRGLDALKRMAPVEYVKGGRKEIGFIAQDAQKVIPEAVSSDELGYLGQSYGQTTALVASALLDLAERLEKKGLI